MFIYKIKFPNNKCYIGQTNNFDRRIKQHKYESYYKRKNLKIYNAIRKYGIENCKAKILFECKEDESDYFEKFYIKEFNSVSNGYNVEIGGNRNKCSDETKKKISKALVGKKKPLRTKEHIKNLSLSLKGRKSPMKGKKLSFEHKKKISESLKGREPWNKGKKRVYTYKTTMGDRNVSYETPQKIKGEL